MPKRARGAPVLVLCLALAARARALSAEHARECLAAATPYSEIAECSALKQYMTCARNDQCDEDSAPGSTLLVLFRTMCAAAGDTTAQIQSFRALCGSYKSPNARAWWEHWWDGWYSTDLAIGLVIVEIALLLGIWFFMYREYRRGPPLQNPATHPRTFAVHAPPGQHPATYSPYVPYT